MSIKLELKEGTIWLTKGRSKMEFKDAGELRRLEAVAKLMREGLPVSITAVESQDDGTITMSGLKAVFDQIMRETTKGGKNDA